MRNLEADNIQRQILDNEHLREMYLNSSLFHDSVEGLVHGSSTLDVLFNICQIADSYMKQVTEGELLRPHQIVLNGVDADRFIREYGHIVTNPTVTVDGPVPDQLSGYPEKRILIGDLVNMASDKDRYKIFGGTDEDPDADNLLFEGRAEDLRYTGEGYAHALCSKQIRWIDPSSDDHLNVYLVPEVPV